MIAQTDDSGTAVYTPRSAPAYTPSQGSPGPPPAADPGPSSIVTTPGFTPDYGAAIQNQPSYAAAMAANTQAEANASSTRRADLRSAAIQYGGLPSGFNDQYGDIDQATLDAAKGNQYSTVAGLKRNYQQSVDQFRKALAARGALQSGDLNYGQDQLDTGLGQSMYDAGNAFGNTATGAIRNYTGVLDANQRNMVNAITDAQASAYNDPLLRPVAQKTASRDAGLSATYGQDIYSDPDTGTLYTRDGSVFAPPSPSAAAPQYGQPTNYQGSGLYARGLGFGSA